MPDTGTPSSFDPAALGPAATGAASATPKPPDANLIEQTRREIQQIAAEIGELAKQDIPPEEFYSRFLPAVISALGALGGAVWKVNDAGELNLAFQVNLASAQLDDEQRRGRHGLLLRQAIANRQLLAVPPQSGYGDDAEAGNPTNHLLLLAPISIGNETVGVVEILQRADAGPATQRGYLRFLTQMADTASGYLKSRSLQKFSDRQQLWQQLEQFITRVHASLDPRQTAYVIANEGRRFVSCDRVSVVLRRGRRYRVEAVSGLDSVDTRAVHVRALEKLVQRVAVTGEAFWYEGDLENVPPQIEDSLHAFVDETHANKVAILPLWEPSGDADGDTPEAAANTKRELLGTLVVEQFQDGETARGFEHRVQAVADHGAAALANALDHHKIFLLGLWKWVGSLRAVVAARNLPKTAAVLFALVGLTAALTLIPASFEVEGRGTLEPTIRREVFAGIDGTIVKVPVEHGQDVRKDQVLAELRSTSDLDVAVTDLIGKKLATRERVAALERELLGPDQQNPEAQDRLSGELFQLNKTLESIEKQLELYDQKQKQLLVTSPIRGQVMTWQTQDRLLHRTVRQGQALLTVIDPSGPWELQVNMPQRRIGHVKQAAAASDDPLKVTFMLATHPGQEFTGTIQEIGPIADTLEGEEPTVLVRVEIDKVDLPELRPGATVSARVHCGTEPLGYVWLHDVFEFVQSQVLFRL